MERTEKLPAHLRKQLRLFSKALAALRDSYEFCSRIGVKEGYARNEIVEFDALTSRFARAADLYTQKILVLLDTIELEEEGTILDRLNRAEKRNLIPSSYIFREVRDLRNEISHEYVPEDLNKLYQRVLGLAPSLIAAEEPLIAYCQRYLKDS